MEGGTKGGGCLIVVGGRVKWGGAVQDVRGLVVGWAEGESGSVVITFHEMP